MTATRLLETWVLASVGLLATADVAAGILSARPILHVAESADSRCPSPRAGTGAGGDPVVVFAAASLQEAVTEIAEQWTLRTGRKVRLQFDGSSTLARQVRAGAPADVFLTADPEWLEEIKPAKRFDWMANRLVCVVPAGAGGEFDLRRAGSLALAGEQVPAGRYARAAMRAMEIPLPERLVLGASVRDVLAKVSQGGAEAGIVYATDAAVDPGVRVAFTFPLHAHPRIVYAAALLAEDGQGFFDALREPWAKEIVRRRGFLVPE